MREVLDSDILYCDTYGQLKSKLDSGVPNTMLNNSCDVWINFLSVMDLISTF